MSAFDIDLGGRRTNVGEIDYPVSLDDLLREMASKGGSDLHMKHGQPPIYRVHGKLTRQTQYPLVTGDIIRAMGFKIMRPETRIRYDENLEVDCSYHLHGVARYRVNLFTQRQQTGLVMRQIPEKIPTCDEIGLPPVLKDVAMFPRGLVLVTGPTGSGKSTTLAAMIRHVNETRRRHIVTIEDPVEFMHEDIRCTIEQRELGIDTHSVSDALRHVLRQNPDIVLVGELRDLETIGLAITVAETGHLVFGTLHTTDASQTVDRIIDVFPTAQQSQVRMQLSITLASVVSQALLPKRGGGRIAAFEVLVVESATRALIREAKTFQIPTMIQAGAERGMISLDQSLLRLVADGQVTYQDAALKSSDAKSFQERAERQGLVPPEVIEELRAAEAENLAAMKKE
ncbi:MAG: type IV pilus twitching motility protein PilT [Fimbriimonadaceae bacterium]|nr:type IV pilus twitching motility protein PilT [Fimbriimonadaceae bacterium]